MKKPNKIPTLINEFGIHKYWESIIDIGIKTIIRAQLDMSVKIKFAKLISLGIALKLSKNKIPVRTSVNG